MERILLVEDDAQITASLSAFLQSEGFSVETATGETQARQLVEQTAPGDYVLRVRCSKGTYVRTLCHDIGQALGCGGCMAALRRTMAAGFTLSDAVTLEQVQAEGEALLRPVDSLFRDRPAYVLPTPRAVARCRNGNPVSVSEPLPEGEYRVYDPEGDFLCLSCLEGGVLTSIKNFFGA